ncbi:hypothetical protein [Pectinatus frisingensis]|nr:hypothetical protein [Pectinatus frisingensis]
MLRLKPYEVPLSLYFLIDGHKQTKAIHHILDILMFLLMLFDQMTASE